MIVFWICVVIFMVACFASYWFVGKSCRRGSVLAQFLSILPLAGCVIFAPSQPWRIAALPLMAALGVSVVVSKSKLGRSGP
jgi:hypothetical protein